ncbi:MAG: AraC family transcriptional regulator [Terrimicrobiaceae bacterium]
MSDPINVRVNRGAYDRPFSGVGIEFDPLGVSPRHPEISLHETGFLEAGTRWDFPGVFSPFWRFYYNASRGHRVVFNGRVVELVPGIITLIPPHCLFHCQGEGPVSAFWMAFSFTRRLGGDVVPPVLLEARETEMCLIRDLRELILSDQDLRPNEVIHQNSVALLLVTLSRPELVWQAAIPKNLCRLLDHIENQLDTKLSMRELARRAGMSPASFNRTFKSHLGTSPARYVSEMRVREAARLMLQSEGTIDEIAEKTGFPNRAYFSRVFKQITGGAPATFRRTHQTI